MRRGALFLAVAAIALCPAAAQQARYLDPRDVAEAQREHNDLVQELGGAETGPRSAYVESVGRKVGAFSGIATPGQALHFTTLDSAVENAFSVPGGYVYVTRQLLTIMDDESELAFALGHETAHIAANHAHIRQQYASRNPLGVFGQIIGAVFGSSVFSNVLSARAQMDTLSFSREQEYQADTLSLNYMIRAGYDPRGAADLLGSLSRSTALEARLQGRRNRQTPEWASTHPLSENRMQRALAEARATGRNGTGIRNRDVFLNAIDGMYVDDNPNQGIIDGPLFTHPDLKVQFQVPTGYLMSNGARAVTIAGSAGKAQFRQGPPNLDQAILFAFRELTEGQMQLQVPTPQRTTINGMPVAFTTARVQTGSGVTDASVVAYQWDPTRVYYFVMLTPGGYGLQPFATMINSLRKVTPQEAAAIRPRIMRVITVGPGDTVQTLASRMAYRDFKVDRFLSLNGLAPNATLASGQKVKLVVYGQRRS